MDTSTTVFNDVKSVVVATLGIEDRADTLDASTVLLGDLPELDSMAVVELVVALEQRFDIEIDGDEVTADLFETLGGLADFVSAKVR
ncbi:acyl carrier protein [Micromonospora krabiensis]|uniref:Acyl carrier protein n=1 Tax=Micromonospora krabiensis TaxID=307121 RepID=A0A1C3N1R7_9ACTN|nr:acyl carrier protein [Micromonospora krabiensis]SBV26543.1 acyl carrier protein [Micromonospora krabiensis]